MGINLKSKFIHPISLSCFFLVLSILVSSLLCQTTLVRTLAEESYFKSETFMNTLADLTCYLKQREIEGKDIYYKKYSQINNLVYSIGIDDPQGEKTSYTNYQGDYEEIEDIKNASKFYYHISFSDAYNYRFESSFGYYHISEHYFKEAFSRLIRQGRIGRCEDTSLGYKNIDVWYFIMDVDYYEGNGFIYDNIKEYEKTACLKIAILVHIVAVGICAAATALIALLGKNKGYIWRMPEKVCIELKIALAIYLCVKLRSLFWELRQPWSLVRILDGTNYEKMIWLIWYTLGSLVIMLIMSWYISDIISMLRNGLRKSIKKQSFISKHHVATKIYEIFGLDISRPCGARLVCYHLIHMISLLLLVAISSDTEELGIIVMILYCIFAGMIGAAKVHDEQVLVHQIKKIKESEDIQYIKISYMKTLRALVIYGISLFGVVFFCYVEGFLGLFVAVVVWIGGLIWSIDQVKKYQQLYQYVLEIKGGKEAVKPAKSFLAPIIDELSQIDSSFKEAVNQELVSQRMKTELISNVSHDLKTPLTSIINYVDLLKKKDLTEEEREEYLHILDQKSQRLKILIEDLFEASKTASGNIKLDKEKINLIALLKQTLGEMAEKISASSLQFKVNLPDEKIYCYLDGRRTYRIFENLLGNILKYAAPHTRVYIDCKIEDEVCIIFKNISAYEMNFTAEEITERFRRGDESRHTEGSGLGLAIAKNLVELQEGKMEITIDGDLFKVEVYFKYEQLEMKKGENE